MNKYERRSKKTYDKKAENYEDTYDGKFTVKFKEMVCKNLNIAENQTVADIACGNGRLLNILSKKYTFKGYGVDLSPKMIERAQQLNPNMQFFVNRCDELPLKDGEADIMIVCAAFHHFPCVTEFAKEAGRVVKIGGELIIADVYLPTLLRVLLNAFIRLSPAGDVKIYSPKQIVRLFNGYGFAADSVAIDGKIQLIKLKKTNN